MIESKPTIEFKPNWDESVDNFDDLNLKPDLLKGIYDYGFIKPRSTQAKGILPLIKHKNVIARFPYGDGATSTLAIATLQLIDTNLQACQAVILTSTRELALQTQRMIVSLGEHLKVSAYNCVGGINGKEDPEKLESGIQIVTGSPKRICEIIKQGFLKVDNLKLLALDGADELLERDLLGEIKEIFSHVETGVQIAIFANTMPPKILDFAKDVVKDPTMLLVEEKKVTVKDIKQFYIPVENDESKPEALMKLVDSIDVQKCLIYCNKKRTIDELATKLKEKNYPVKAMHTDMIFREREHLMQEFKTGACRFYICSDFMQQAVEIPTAPLVINYELPLPKEYYLYRMGKTVKWNSTRAVISIVTPSDHRHLKNIEEYCEVQSDELPANVSSIFD